MRLVRSLSTFGDLGIVAASRSMLYNSARPKLTQKYERAILMSRLPAVHEGMLQQPKSEGILAVPVGTPEWFAWLDTTRSFTFEGAGGSFTARHEERSGRRFWYAYRQQEGVLRKTYLGRSADLTLQRLEQAAATLAQADGRQARASAPSSRAHSHIHTHAHDHASHHTQAEWSMPLIATKIAMPPPVPALIERPQAVAHCLECLERPCTIISAPPGFGKTTLLLMACEQVRLRGWRVAWLSLEEAEQDPVRFWSYTLAALDAAYPGVSTLARRLLETLHPAPIEQGLTALVNALADIETPLVLVLDDYHRAATPASDQGLAFLIEHAPATLHLVITTRAEPALPLSRLRAQGRIAELHTADLRFSAEEAGRFLRETMRLALPQEQLARLSGQAEGWVAGLQLAALSLRDQGNQGDTLDIPATAATTPRYIADYLIAEVLDHQPPEVQAFLLQTSVLERLIGPLCDAVTGCSDSAAMLVRLMQAHLFVTPLDAGQTWYRYHHLFAEVLRERLARTAPDTLRLCHRRAAAWLREQGMTGEAIRHLIAAKAYDEAAALIEAESDRLTMHGEIASLGRWAHMLPRDVMLAHPNLAVLSTTSLILRGEGTDAVLLLDDLERRLARNEEEASEVQGEIAVIRALMTLIAGDFIKGAALAGEALRQLRPESQLLRGLALWIVNIVGVMGDEDLAETSQALTGMVEESLRAGNVLVAFIGLITRAGIEVYQGRLHRAAQTCRETLRLVPRMDGQELPITAMAYCLLGEIRREWNDLAGAEDDLRHALAVAGPLSSAEFVNDGLVSLAMVQAAHGNFDEALATFEELRHLIHTQQLAAWDAIQMEIMWVRVLLAQGNVAEAAHWAEMLRRNRQQQHPNTTFQLLRELEDLSLTRVALAEGHLDGVITTLEALCKAARSAGRMRNLLDARMLLARARWMSGEGETALCDLDAALALAAPEGFARVFLDEGEPMADLLEKYVASYPLRTREHAYAHKLLAAFGRSVAPSASDPISITLSPRELDVLRLLAAGSSNEQIAKELVVALSTVKWHVANIYRKLGVAGRVQVITRARELHLIA